jgi:hypothetical protein
MTRPIDIKIPDIDDFKDVPVIDGALATRLNAYPVGLPEGFSEGGTESRIATRLTIRSRSSRKAAAIGSAWRRKRIRRPPPRRIHLSTIRSD